MPAVCFYFQVHQPYRVKKYRIFDVGNNHDYFDGEEGTLNNKAVLQKVANKSYLPANKLMLELLKRHPEFKVSYSLSGVLLEQLEQYSPETLESFQRLVDTGRVELLSETYYHSLSYLYSKPEFKRQVRMHAKKLKKLFNYEPKVFRNTELIYNNELAKDIEDMGYIGILAEGADHILGWRSPDFLYRPVGAKRIGLLLKNYKLSDDIAFRFSTPYWEEYPLYAPKYSQWITTKNGAADIINLFMDYETFGEHQWEDTGIFNFLNDLPNEILKHKDNSFVTTSEAVKKFNPISEIDFPFVVTWADVERDLTAWLGNPIQHDAVNKLYELEEKILRTKNNKLIEDWRKLQTSDHFYYMCTKWFADGDVHAYFNPYDSPYDAFISFMNALKDLKLQTSEALSKGKGQGRGHPKAKSAKNSPPSKQSKNKKLVKNKK